MNVKRGYLMKEPITKQKECIYHRKFWEIFQAECCRHSQTGILAKVTRNVHSVYSWRSICTTQLMNPYIKLEVTCPLNIELQTEQ